MTTTELFLIALAIIFAGPWLVWRLSRTDYWAPLVVVQIVGGIMLGPGVIGAVFPEYYATVFRPDVMAALNGVAWWAVILFVWVAGLELDLASAWLRRGEVAVVAGFALATPLATGALAGAALIASGPGWAGPRGAAWQVALGIGMACAVTALPILILLMERMRLFREPLGQRILRYASADDLAIWGVLAIILVDWIRIGRQGAFLAGFALAAVAMRRLMAQLTERDRWPVGLIWLAASAAAADWAGLHFMVGAFLAGVVLDARWFGTAAIDRFRDVVLMALMPVFFLSTGLRTTWGAGGVAVFAAAALMLVASVGGKLAGVAVAGRLLGWRRGEAWTVGWLLQTKALIMIIFASVLLDKAIIAPATFTALLLMAVASTMLTTPMVEPALRRARTLAGGD